MHRQGDAAHIMVSYIRPRAIIIFWAGGGPHSRKPELIGLVTPLPPPMQHAAKNKLAREIESRQQEEEKHTARLKEVARR